MAKSTHSKAARPAHRHEQAGGARPGGSKIAGPFESPAIAHLSGPLRPAPAAARPSPEAVALFERGMGAMQRHDYRLASDSFQTLLAGFCSERALIERARLYLGVCERELGRRPQVPATVEEQVTAATAALNEDRDGEADRLARRVLDVAPDHDLALYLLAAVHARRGDADAALEWLRRAAAVSPDVRAQVKHDADFDAIRDLEGFQRLLEAPAGAQSGMRNGRRPRSDR
jgi:tetratricopeptide (TPR) repeat protein